MLWGARTAARSEGWACVRAEHVLAHSCSRDYPWGLLQLWATTSPERPRGVDVRPPDPGLGLEGGETVILMTPPVYPY